MGTPKYAKDTINRIMNNEDELKTLKRLHIIRVLISGTPSFLGYIAMSNFNAMVNMLIDNMKEMYGVEIDFKKMNEINLKLPEVDTLIEKIINET